MENNTINQEIDYILGKECSTCPHSTNCLKGLTCDKNKDFQRMIIAGVEWHKKQCGNLRLKVMEAAVESFRLIIDKYQLNMPVDTALCGRDIMKDFIDWMAEKCRI